MAATGKAYPMLAKSLSDGLVDFDSDTFKVMLLSAYTYAATHQFVSDVKAAGTESSSGVYTTGGEALASVTFTRSGDVYTFDAADLSIDATTGTDAKYGVIADTTPGTDATNPVVGYINLDGSAGTVSVLGFTWHASGILTVTAA
jgi:hypothetical protein